MAVRSTMAALISRVRLLINDPAGASQVFADQDVQDVLDESRQDMYNLALVPKPTFSGNTPLYLDYLSKAGGWEDDYAIKQYLTVPVTPNTAEPIAGHFHFNATTLPPLYITGKLFDVYRASADLLERWAARYVTRFDFTSDGQSFRVSQATVQLLDLAHTYRMKQRAVSVAMLRDDLNKGQATPVGLGPTEIDFMASG